MFQDNDMVVYDPDEELTCPDCGSECKPLDPSDCKGGVAECQGCGIAFNFTVDTSCPLCMSEDTKRDADFPDTMLNCKSCGAEWNHMEVTLDPTKV